MTNEEATIKMAEMCGYVSEGDGKFFHYDHLITVSVNPRHTGESTWNPEKNIAQALEVVQGWIGNHISRSVRTLHDSYGCVIYLYDSPKKYIRAGGKTIEEAIFQAVKAYLEGAEG